MGLITYCTKKPYEDSFLTTGRFSVQRPPRALSRACFLQAQKKRPKKGNALLGDHARQPFDVAASRTVYGVHAVAQLSFEMTAVHAVIALAMTNDGIDGLTTFELPSRLCRDPLGLAQVHDPHSRAIRIHRTIAQIDEGRVELAPQVRHEAL